MNSRMMLPGKKVEEHDSRLELSISSLPQPLTIVEQNSKIMNNINSNNNNNFAKERNEGNTQILHEQKKLESSHEGKMNKKEIEEQSEKLSDDLNDSKLQDASIVMCANCNCTTPTLDALRMHAKEVHQQDLDDVGEEIIKSGKNLIIRFNENQHYINVLSMGARSVNNSELLMEDRPTVNHNQICDQQKLQASVPLDYNTPDSIKPMHPSKVSLGGIKDQAVDLSARHQPIPSANLSPKNDTNTRKEVTSDASNVKSYSLQNNMASSQSVQSTFASHIRYPAYNQPQQVQQQQMQHSADNTTTENSSPLSMQMFDRSHGQLSQTTDHDKIPVSQLSMSQVSNLIGKDMRSNHVGINSNQQTNFEHIDITNSQMYVGNISASQTHFQSRNSSKKLKCPKCNWHYKYKETLEAHMKEKHSDENPDCSFCNSGSLHPRLARGESYTCGYKPYRCDVCNYSTTTKGNLSIHMQSDKHLHNVRTAQQRQASEQIRKNVSLITGYHPGNKAPDGSTFDDSAANVEKSLSMHPANLAIMEAEASSASNENSGNSRKRKVTSKAIMPSSSVGQLANNTPILSSMASAVRGDLTRSVSYDEQPEMLRIKVDTLTQQLSAMQRQNVMYSQKIQQLLMYQQAYFQNPHIQHVPTTGLPQHSIGFMPPNHQLSALHQMQLLKNFGTGLTNGYGVNYSAENRTEGGTAKFQLSIQFVFSCHVCMRYGTDDLGSLEQHVRKPRSYDSGYDANRMDEWVARMQDDSFYCKLCKYTTMLKTNFNLHCKTEKHSNKINMINHVREGGRESEWLIPYAMSSSINPLATCNICRFPASTLEKLKAHCSNEAHCTALNICRVLDGLMKSSSRYNLPKGVELKFHCRFCDSFYSSFVIEVVRHLSEDAHKMNQMQAKGNVYNTNINEVISIEQVPLQDSNEISPSDGCSPREEEAMDISPSYSKYAETQVSETQQEKLDDKKQDSLPDSTVNRTQTYEKHSNNVIMPENFNNNLIIDEDLDNRKNVYKQQSTEEIDAATSTQSAKAFSASQVFKQKLSAEQLDENQTSLREDAETKRSKDELVGKVLKKSASLSDLSKLNNCDKGIRRTRSYSLIVDSEKVSYTEPKSRNSTGLAENSSSTRGETLNRSKLEKSSILNQPNFQNQLHQALAMHNDTKPNVSDSDNINSPSESNQNEARKNEDNSMMNGLLSKFSESRVQNILKACGLPTMNPLSMFSQASVNQMQYQQQQQQQQQQHQQQHNQQLLSLIYSLLMNPQYQNQNMTTNPFMSPALQLQQQFLANTFLSQRDQNNLNGPRVPYPNLPLFNSLNGAMPNLEHVGFGAGLLVPPNNASVDQQPAAFPQSHHPATTSQSSQSQHQSQSEVVRRPRTRISDEQLKILRENFDIATVPGEEQIKSMAEQTGLPYKVIKHWFRNTLFKERQRSKDSPYNFNIPPTLSLNDAIYQTPTNMQPSVSTSSDGEKKQKLSTGINLPEKSDNSASNAEHVSDKASNLDSFIQKNSPSPTSSSPKIIIKPGFNLDLMGRINDSSGLFGNDLSGQCDLYSFKSDNNSSFDGSGVMQAMGTSHRRPARTRFTDVQLQVLQSLFQNNPYPKDDDLDNLSRSLDLSQRVIVVWFQNARQKARKQLEQQQQTPMQFSIRGGNLQQIRLNDPSDNRQSSNMNLKKMNHMEITEDLTQTRTSLPGSENKDSNSLTVMSSQNMDDSNDPNKMYNRQLWASIKEHFAKSQNQITEGLTGNGTAQDRERLLSEEESVNNISMPPPRTPNALKRTYSSMSIGTPVQSSTPFVNQSSANDLSMANQSVKASNEDKNGMLQKDTKRLRTTITSEQLKVLYEYYNSDHSPSRKVIEQIAQEVGLTKRVVQVWFQNTRARQRKGQGRSGMVNRFGTTSNYRSCPHCRTILRNQEDYDYHIRTIHSDRAPFSNQLAIRDSADSMSEKPSYGVEKSSGSVPLSQKPEAAGSSFQFRREGYERSGGFSTSANDFSRAITNYNNSSPFSLVKSYGRDRFENSPTLLNHLDLGNKSANQSTSKILSRNETLPEFSQAENLSPRQESSHQFGLNNSINHSKCLTNDHSAGGFEFNSISQLSGEILPGTEQSFGQKRHRTHLTTTQKRVMKQCFKDCRNPSLSEREIIARAIGLDNRVVQVWFQNHRAKEKRKAGQSNEMIGRDAACGLDGFQMSTKCNICEPEVFFSESVHARNHLFSMPHLLQIKQLIENGDETAFSQSGSSPCSSLDGTFVGSEADSPMDFAESNRSPQQFQNSSSYNDDNQIINDGHPNASARNSPNHCDRNDAVINEVGNAENPLQNEGSSMMRPFTRENIFSGVTGAANFSGNENNTLLTYCRILQTLSSQMQMQSRQQHNNQ